MEWIDVGDVSELRAKLAGTSLFEFKSENLTLAISLLNNEFGAISGVCNHYDGPLGKGRLDGEYVVCPWHYWKFHRITGQGEPGFESDCVPRHEVKVEAGRLLVKRAPSSTRNRAPHTPHPLSREVRRQPGKTRVLGISTTAMTKGHPRTSTSEHVLQHALNHAKEILQVDTQFIALNDLNFRSCEGFYSKHSRACTWPCSITQMDPNDQLDRVYEAVVHWADVVCVATPIRWGSASALYYKMVERFNCVQNQITVKDNRLIKNKVSCFVITGGQDNIQSVAGQMMTFFSELGFALPPFPFVAHSLGWTAENMEKNIEYVLKDQELREGAVKMICRAVSTAEMLIATEENPKLNNRGGRKGFDPMKADDLPTTKT